MWYRYRRNFNGRKLNTWTWRDRDYWMIELMEHQLNAVAKMGNGKILWGGVGSGKSATTLEYYMRNEAPADIFVITTAKKRDSLDWEGEAAKFGIGTEYGATVSGKLTVDSWNNIGNYVGIEKCFFIFDEQRAVGYGPWVKAFLKITQNNRWVILSATPGDSWMDYAPVFIANGYYKNITDFRMKHVVYAPRVKYPMILRYMNEEKLERLRDEVLVEMPYFSTAQRGVNWIPVGHDADVFNKIVKTRWNVFKNEPIEDAAELRRVLRRVINSDPSRLDMVRDLMKVHDRLIVFYNFNYELDILRTLGDEITVAEWNGHKKEPIPNTDKWIYLTQYMSGSEGWNCIETNAMIMYSLTHSYKNFEQAFGRIDRLDTPYKMLYYYVFISDTFVDKGIKSSLDRKEDFNLSKFVKELRRQEGVSNDKSYDKYDRF